MDDVITLERAPNGGWIMYVKHDIERAPVLLGAYSNAADAHEALRGYMAVKERDATTGW